MISTRHEVFLTVAHQQSFSKASDLLYISQPAISNHIKALESFYKTKLFNRKWIHRGLTPSGLLLYEKLQFVKKIQNQTEFEIATLND